LLHFHQQRDDQFVTTQQTPRMGDLRRSASSPMDITLFARRSWPDFTQQRQDGQ
jgi:hypothetical protein